MNANVMERAPLTQIIGTVVFKHPAPAPNRSGKLKLEDGRILSAFPDKLVMVEVGGTYDFGCVVTEKAGVNYHDVKVVRATTQAPPPRPAYLNRVAPDPPQPTQQQRSAPVQELKPPPKPQPNYGYQTHPRDSERMFVCANLTAYIRAGRIENDVATLTDAVNKLRDVWANTFGMDTEQS